MPYRVEEIQFYVRKTLEGTVVVGICVMTGMKKSVESVSCYNELSSQVEIIQGEPYPLNQEKCVGCRICLEMCPNRAIEVNAIPQDAKHAGFGCCRNSEKSSISII